MEKKPKRQRTPYNGGRTRFRPETLEIIEYLTKNWVTKDDFERKFHLNKQTTPATYCSYVCKHSVDMYRTKLRHTYCKGQVVETAWRLSVKGDALWYMPTSRKMYVAEFVERTTPPKARETTQAERDEIVRRINKGEDMRTPLRIELMNSVRKPQRTDEELNADKRQGLDERYITISNGAKRVNS